MNVDIIHSLTYGTLIAATSNLQNNNGTVTNISNFTGELAIIVNTGPAAAGTTPGITFSLYTSNQADGLNSTNLAISSVTPSNASAANQQILTLDTRAAGLKKYIFAVPITTGTNNVSFPATVSYVGRQVVEPVQ